MRRRRFLGIAGVTVGGLALGAPAYAVSRGRQNGMAYLSGYTSSGAPGVGIATWDASTGELALRGTVDGGPDPSWITFGWNEEIMYASNELVPDGTLSAVRMEDPPVPINSMPSGEGPVHVEAHPGGSKLFSSLYTTGQVAVHWIRSQGGVGKVVHREQHPTEGEKQPIVHQTRIDSTGNWLLVCDLGLDSVFVYRFDNDSGALRRTDRIQLDEGSGPRHLAFDPDEKFVYVANETNSTVTTATWDSAAGKLTPVETVSTLPDPPPAENTVAEVVVADGFVYVSNRGHDSIAVFAADAATGKLELLDTPSCGGQTPRNIELDPTGNWLYVANQGSGEVVWFPRDQKTGELGEQAGALEFPAVSRVLFPRL